MVNENSQKESLQLTERIKTPLNLPGGERTEKVQPRYVTANPAIYKKIRQIQESLRKNPTKAEKIIWKYLRNKKTGHKIRRQHIIDCYIADFVCLRKKLIIEIDGKIHIKQRENDEFRTSILNELGFKVIRFSNDDIYRDPETIALLIKEILDSIS
ncbi:MAG: endonuclease domain-containing protein [bacterium]|nr:endonuclease domain-containing protein [bacterium]